MAAFSVADVKTLRDRLGAGMLDSKNALVEADGDIEKAIEILRVKGAKGDEKRAGRSTTAGPRHREGRRRRRDPDRARQRDRLRREERPVHRPRRDRARRGRRRRAPTDVEAAKAAPVDGEDRRRRTSTTRPRSSARRSSSAASSRSPATQFAIYLHKTSKDLPPQVGVVLGYAGDDAETARSRRAAHRGLRPALHDPRGRAGGRGRARARDRDRDREERGQARGALCRRSSRAA